jgi:AraC-like DNA-binding protein
MSTPAHRPALSLIVHPYQHQIPILGGKKQLRAEGRRPGSALVWHLEAGLHEQDANVVRDRPGGLPLIVVLPHLPHGLGDPALLRGVEATRPLAVLPYHPHPVVADLLSVLRKPPEDLGVEVADYLAWRGVVVDRETTQLIRRTISLSADLRSITALCRSMYLSRRALGRRFLSRGLPVPSHWLHFARLLRVAIRLQNSHDSVLSVGYELGYPDAFSLSNQMYRLVGHRPSEVREYLGWEWLVEAWLRREADTGGLAPDFTVEILAAPMDEAWGGFGVRAVAERAGLETGDPGQATG